MDGALEERGAAERAEALERGGEFLTREGDGELEAPDGAALTVLRDVARALERRGRRPGRARGDAGWIAGEVDDLRLRVSVGNEILVEGGDGPIAHVVLEIIFEGQVVGVGAPGLEVGIAAAAAERALQRIGRGRELLVVAVGGACTHVVHALAGELTGGAETERLTLVEAEVEVQAGDEVGVGVVPFDLRDRRAVGGETGGGLVGVHDLGADVTGERNGAHLVVEVELGVGERDLLVHIPVVGDVGRVVVRDEVVETAVEEGEGIVAVFLAHADEAEVGGADGGRQRGAGGAALEREEVAFAAAGAGLDLILGALGERHARLEAAERALHRMLGLEPVGGDLVAGNRALDEADLAAGDVAAGPALGTGEAHQARVRVVEQVRERGAAFALAQRVGERLGGARLVGGVARVGLEDEVFALHAGVADVEVGLPTLLVAEFQIPTAGEEVIVAFHEVIADDAVDILEGALRDEAVGDGVAGLEDGGAPLERNFDAAEQLSLLEIGVEEVDGGMDFFGRGKLDHGDGAVAFDLARPHERLGAAEDERALVIGDVGVAPRIPLVALTGAV